jgi:hypothetical protein
MKTTIRDAVRGLRSLEGRAIRGAERGLAAQSGALVADLRATDAHGDVTGATRAGYTAGVQGPTLDTLSGAVATAAAEVERRNPGHSLVADVGERGAVEVAVVLTCPTDYQQYLSGNSAGARDALGPTLTRNAGRLTQAAAAGIRQELGG